jgi:hypothetical protein
MRARDTTAPCAPPPLQPPVPPAPLPKSLPDAQRWKQPAPAAARRPDVGHRGRR